MSINDPGSEEVVWHPHFCDTKLVSYVAKLSTS